MVLKYLFPEFLNYHRRRWTYALVEVLSVAVFALCSSTAIMGRPFRIGLDDPGMPRITAMALMGVTAALFTLVVSVKQIDHE